MTFRLCITRERITSEGYQYGPFGELLRATGPMAKANPFGFSTKYRDDEPDLAYFGYRFYHSGLGRWLRRDPFEERGGANTYSFVANCPAGAFDPDGRMTLRVFSWELPQPPTKGPYTWNNGLTWFNVFEPRATTYPSLKEPCCWKIFLPGQADIYSWWVKDAPEEVPGESAKDHEMRHIAIHRDTYNGFNASASDYVGQCFSKAKAGCFKSVINGPLKDAWLDHNHTANLQLDCDRLHDRCSEIPQAVDTERSAWERLAKEAEKCVLMD